MRAGARKRDGASGTTAALSLRGPHPPFGHLVWGVFCQGFCCRSFLSRKSAIFTLAERASPAVIDPFVWSPGPAACHWLCLSNLLAFNSCTSWIARSGSRQRSGGGAVFCASEPVTALYAVRSQDLDHDAVMRIGGQAPRWWAHSSPRL